MAGRDLGLTLPYAWVQHWAPVEVIRLMLERFGWLPLFLLLVSSEDVSRGKPAPDVFREVLRRDPLLATLDRTVRRAVSWLGARNEQRLRVDGEQGEIEILEE